MYMEYSRLGTVLKRYSFDEKMRIAQDYSQKTINSEGMIGTNKWTNEAFPWELETFVLFAVNAIEYDNKDFKGKNVRKFIEIINCIREEIPVYMKTMDGKDRGMWFLTTTASVQFDIQEHYPFKMFRFSYFFTYVSSQIDMKKIFKDTFGCDYASYCLLGEMLWLGNEKGVFSQSLINSILEKLRIPFSHLVITRQAYIEALSKITTDPIDYLYCLRPSYTYPFIESEGKIYCPLPHLFCRATTSSLMHRLTDGDADLRAKIGKEVYEGYLYTIINESGIFDEVISEKTYKHKKMERRTVDVMTRVGQSYVFFDSKSFSPKTAIRTFSAEALEQDIQRLAESLAQIYKHIFLKFPNEYNYFERDVSSHVEIYGLVVVQEEAYIIGNAIYEKTAEILGISVNSEEYVRLCTHVGVVSIYNVECYCFTKTDMLQSLRAIRDGREITSSWLTGQTAKDITYKRYLDFNKQLINDMKSVLGLSI